MENLAEMMDDSFSKRWSVTLVIEGDPPDTEIEENWCIDATYFHLREAVDLIHSFQIVTGCLALAREQNSADIDRLPHSVKFAGGEPIKTGGVSSLYSSA
jgi:hypothetical protein